jgi:hypothetical protein
MAMTIAFNSQTVGFLSRTAADSFIRSSALPLAVQPLLSAAIPVRIGRSIAIRVSFYPRLELAIIPGLIAVMDATEFATWDSLPIYPARDNCKLLPKRKCMYIVRRHSSSVFGGRSQSRGLARTCGELAPSEASGSA